MAFALCHYHARLHLTICSLDTLLLFLTGEIQDMSKQDSFPMLCIVATVCLLSSYLKTCSMCSTLWVNMMQENRVVTKLTLEQLQK